jgi:hypothetical protein
MAYRYYPPRLTELDLPSSGLFYPTAIRQLLTGVYFMELCLAGLFFLVRDTENRPACTAQAVIMLVATVLTALFHYTLNGGLHWPFHYKHLSEAETGATNQAPELDDALTSSSPVLWVPTDDLGISADEISHACKGDVFVSNKGAYLERGKLRLDGSPPALSKPR